LQKQLEAMTTADVGRFADEVVLCFDADAAGEKATVRSLPALFGQNLQVRVVEMPPGEDPDSLIRKSGSAAFIERVTAAPDYFEYQIARQMRKPEFGTPRGKTTAARSLANDISLVRDPVLREAILQRASLRFEIGLEQFTAMLPRLASDQEERTEETKHPFAYESSEAARSAETGQSGGNQKPRAEMDSMHHLLLRAILRDSGAREWVQQQEWARVFAFETDGELVAEVLGAEIDLEEASSVAAFIAGLDGHAQDALTGILEAPLLPNLVAVAQETWYGIVARQIRRQMEALRLRMRKPDISTEEVVQTHHNLLDLQEKLKNLPRPSMAGNLA
jgi:DNA primase